MVKKIRVLKVNDSKFENIIGKVFKVVHESATQYHIIDNSGSKLYITKQNAVVVKDVEKSCETCGLSLKNRKKDIFCEEVVGTCKDNDKWQPIEQVEEKSCDNCKYDDLLGDEHPCNNCSPSRDMWKPIEQAEEKIAGVGQDAPNVKPAGKFENIGRSLGELVDEKQQAYGDAITAVEQMMMVLYPNGVNPDQFRDMLLMVRIMDKQCRIAKGDKSAFGESPFKDIAGYGLLGAGHGQ